MEWVLALVSEQAAPFVVGFFVGLVVGVIAVFAVMIGIDVGSS
jgi:hypothetical protein